MNATTAPQPRRVRTAAATTLLVALVALGACGGGSSAEGTTTTSAKATTTTTDPTAPPAGAVAKGFNSLQTGQCFLPVEGNEQAEDRAVWVVECSDPHLYELYARLKYTGPGAASGGFPGSTTVQNWAEEQCFERFEDYVGVPWTRSDLEIQTWWPSLQSWGRPDRTVLCAVTPADGGLTTGSKAASGTSGDGSDPDAEDGSGSTDEDSTDEDSSDQTSTDEDSSSGSN